MGVFHRQCVGGAAAAPHSPIPRDRAWLAVRSCFGGAAVYRWDKVKGCRYSGSHAVAHCGGSAEVCEHVSFNLCVGRNTRADGSAGGSSGIFINPAFENS